MSKNLYLKVKDHSVSGEEFELLRHKTLDMLVTSPQPKGSTLSEYYKSEDYISHTDNKRNLLEWAYHLVRKQAIRRKLNLIRELNAGGKVLLDVGCGTGDFLAYANKKGWEPIGIEPNEKARALASEKLQKNIYDENQLYKIQPNSINVITLWHVLEHLPNVEEHLELFNNVLSSSGYLVIAVPNHKSYDAVYYKTFWAAYDVPRHLWHFSRTSIKDLLRQNGFSFVSEHPMYFDSFYVSLLSEKYKSGKANWFKAVYIGLKSNIKAIRTGEYSSLIYVFKKGNI